MKKDYPINIFYSHDDKCYVADIPDLRFCSAFGDTPTEALKEVLIAKQLWLDVAKETGRPIPNPSNGSQTLNSPKQRKNPSNGRPIRASKRTTRQKIRSA